MKIIAKKTIALTNKNMCLIKGKTYELTDTDMINELLSAKVIDTIGLTKAEPKTEPKVADEPTTKPKVEIKAEPKKKTTKKAK